MPRRTKNPNELRARRCEERCGPNCRGWTKAETSLRDKPTTERTNDFQIQISGGKAHFFFPLPVPSLNQCWRKLEKGVAASASSEQVQRTAPRNERHGAKLSILRAIGEVTLNLAVKLARQQQTGFALPFERARRGDNLVASFQAFAISFAVNRPSQPIDFSAFEDAERFRDHTAARVSKRCFTNPHFAGSNKQKQTPLTEETISDLLRVSIISLTSFRRPSIYATPFP